VCYSDQPTDKVDVVGNDRFICLPSLQRTTMTLSSIHHNTHQSIISILMSCVCLPDFFGASLPPVPVPVLVVAVVLVVVVVGVVVDVVAVRAARSRFSSFNSAIRYLLEPSHHLQHLN
jgi:hypothetical protein